MNLSFITNDINRLKQQEMKTKIVYTIVTDETDFYLEQLLISVVSLRHYNADAHVALVTDEESNASFMGNRKVILNYFDEVVVVKAPNEYNKILRSRYLKTTLRQHIRGNYLFMDTDTLVAGPLGDIDQIAESCIKIAAVRQINMPFEQYLQRRKDLKHRGLILDATKDKAYFNSGVMYVADIPEARHFFERWNANWILNWQSTGIIQDQRSLVMTNREFPDIIEHLDDSWNCMIVKYGLPYLSTAKIIHYIASGATRRITPYIFNDKSVFEKVKQSFDIPSDILPYVLNPRSAFYPKCTLLTYEADEQLALFKQLMVEYPKSFNIFRFCARACSKVLNKICQ